MAAEGASDNIQGTKRGINRPTPFPVSSPFTIRPLDTKSLDTHSNATGPPETQASLFPAAYSIDDEILAPPSHDSSKSTVTKYLESDLDLSNLNEISSWFWTLGLCRQPRPLHHQLLLGREIFVAERMDLHLLWYSGHVFIKPVPRYLLDPDFWEKNLSCAQGCEHSDTECTLPLRKTALGFLISQAALIASESDFHIAKSHHLLPSEVSWPAWCTLVRQLLAPFPSSQSRSEHVNPRFHRGELRLGRINKIVFLRRLRLRSYITLIDDYSSFFGLNLSWLTAATVYMALVLTAMQVGLATEALANDPVYQSISYGFSVFSILGPLVYVGLLGMVFCAITAKNFVVAWSKKHLRHRDRAAVSASDKTQV